MSLHPATSLNALHNSVDFFVSFRVHIPSYLLFVEDVLYIYMERHWGGWSSSREPPHPRGPTCVSHAGRRAALCPALLPLWSFSFSREGRMSRRSPLPVCFLLLGAAAPQGLPARVCSLTSVSRFRAFCRALVLFHWGVSPSPRLLRCGRSRGWVMVVWITAVASSQWLLAVRTRSSQAHLCSFFPSCTRQFLSSCFRPGTILETGNIRVN